MECVDCGKEIEMFECKVGNSVYKIKMERCNICGPIAKEKDEQEKRDQEFFINLNEAKLPKNCLKLIKSKDYELTYGQKKVVSKLKGKDLWEEPYPFIWGDVGCGKTFLSSLILYSYMKKQSRPAYFFSIGSIISSRYGNIQEDPSGFKAPLVLDDLGNHIINQKIVAALLDVVNRRMNEGLPTIITCNTDPISLGDRFVSHLGPSESYLVESLCDRILEFSNPIRVEGKSIRTAKFIEAHK